MGITSGPYLCLMLYVVPTPIGNQKDITNRALEVLASADLILAEDTRTSGSLLKHHGLKKEMRSFHAFNEHKVLNNLLDEMVNGVTMAMVSDAGTPGISDPGFLLIRGAIERDIKVVCLPGPTALIPALVMSGLPSDKFYFEGFLPHKKGRQTRWKWLSELPCTIVLYESPHRIAKCIEEVVTHCGEDRMVSISREISKVYEENIRGTAKDVSTLISTKKLKGEIVVCIEGKT